ncbi:MAG TPA: serpin family protein [Bryobacteraceae bacterium]|nr:serpin family protein [Bryobacteraceae bacterium]
MSHPFALALPLVLAGALFAANNLTPGLNQFASASYRQLSKGQGNLILSPFCISTALSMLLEGARGQTATSIAAALHQHPGQGYQEAVAALAAELGKSANTGPNQLSIANALWVARGFPLEAAFEDAMRTLYQAPLTPLDFAQHAEAAREQINTWTAQQTKDKIRDLFAPGAIQPDTRLVLTSAIYFYGKWQSPFKPSGTRAEPFQLSGGGSVETPFMHQGGGFLYAETPSAQILEMKYDGTPVAFDIVLPKTTDGLPAIEESLDAGTLSGWLGKLTRETVDVAIPKFRAESSFSLGQMLAHLGMAEAFSRQADFSGIDGRRDLFVSQVVHKAFVDVSERGTEAAAATGTVVMAMAVRRRNIVFRADHPFVFFIRDTASGVILFEGRLSHPGQSS